jgi:hypothetical protein
MSLDGVHINIHGVVAHKLNDGRTCPYCGSSEIYESMANGYKNQPKGMIGFVAEWTYHCAKCFESWHTWSDSKKWIGMFEGLNFNK